MTAVLLRPSVGDVELSPVTFGTMRLTAVSDRPAAIDLIERALDMGVNSFHCSSEYDSFPLFVDLWRELRRRRQEARIIAKLPEPHFGDDRFSARNFRSKLDAYLLALRIERVDVVQWLLRYDISQPEARLRILAEARDAIADVTQALRDEGKMGALVVFPYDLAMADAVLDSDLGDGLALYLNPLEREMEAQVRRCERMARSIVAIRPFAAGRVFAELGMDAATALANALNSPAVTTTIASVSSISHLETLRQFVCRSHEVSD